MDEELPARKSTWRKKLLWTGLPAWTTEVLAPLAVVILGPLLTVPYWLDKYSAWAKGKAKKRKSTTSMAASKKWHRTR
jgi:hypothetical protein